MRRSWSFALFSLLLLPAAATGQTVTGPFSLADPVLLRSVYGSSGELVTDGSQYLGVSELAWRFDAQGNRLDMDGIPTPVSNLAINGYPPAAAFGDGVYLVARGGQGVDAYRMTPAGVVLDPVPFIVSNASGEQRVCDLAWNGSEFLAVWEDDRLGMNAAQPFAARITPDGQVIDVNGLALGGATGEALISSHVASDGDAFMVVWPDAGAIRGTLVSAAGVVASPGGDVIQTQGIPRALAFGGGVYMMLWEGAAGDLRVSRIGATGQPVDQGVVIPGAHPFAASIAFHGGEFVVVWSKIPAMGDQSVHGARVSVAGALLDPAGYPLSSPPVFGHVPLLACATNECVVQWNGSVVMPFENDGTQLLGEPLLIATGHVYRTVFDVVRTGNEWMVSFDEELNGLFVGRIDANGAHLDGRGRSLGAMAGLAALAWNGSKLMAALSHSTSMASLFYRFLAADGTPLGAADVLIADPTFHEKAVASDGNTFLVAWTETETNGVHARLFASDGSVLVAEVLPGGVAGSGPSVAVAGGVYMIAVTGPLSGVPTIRVAANGTLLDATPVPVTNELVLGGVRVASDGANFLVAWVRNGVATNELAYRRRAATGAMLDAAPVMLGSTIIDRFDLAFDGHAWVAVLGEHVADGVDSMFIHRVAPGGAHTGARATLLASSDDTRFDEPALDCELSARRCLIGYTTRRPVDLVRQRAFGVLVDMPGPGSALPLGAGCVEDAECASADCSNGVCCDMGVCSATVDAGPSGPDAAIVVDAAPADAAPADAATPELDAASSIDAAQTVDADLPPPDAAPPIADANPLALDAARPGPVDSGGCDCRAAPARLRSPWSSLLALVALLALVRAARRWASSGGCPENKNADSL